MNGKCWLTRIALLLALLLAAAFAVAEEGLVVEEEETVEEVAPVEALSLDVSQLSPDGESASAEDVPATTPEAEETVASVEE